MIATFFVHVGYNFSVPPPLVSKKKAIFLFSQSKILKKQKKVKQTHNPPTLSKRNTQTTKRNNGELPGNGCIGCIFVAFTCKLF